MCNCKSQYVLLAIVGAGGQTTKQTNPCYMAGGLRPDDHGYSRWSNEQFSTQFLDNAPTKMCHLIQEHNTNHP